MGNACLCPSSQRKLRALWLIGHRMLRHGSYSASTAATGRRGRCHPVGVATRIGIERSALKNKLVTSTKSRQGAAPYRCICCWDCSSAHESAFAGILMDWRRIGRLLGSVFVVGVRTRLAFGGGVGLPMPFIGNPVLPQARCLWSGPLTPGLLAPHFAGRPPMTGFARLGAGRKGGSIQPPFFLEPKFRQYSGTRSEFSHPIFTSE